MIASALILALSVTGKGFLTDGSHPKRPGDVQKHEATVRIELDPVSGIATIEIATPGEGDTTDIDRYFVRRGRTFQVDDKGDEIPPRDLGDLSVAAIAALHPGLAASALKERREHANKTSSDDLLSFAWNDVLWNVVTLDGGKTVAGLQRQTFDDVHGDGWESIAYLKAPERVVVKRDGRETAGFAWEKAETIERVEIPKGDGRRDRGHVVEAREIAFREIAPHLFAADLPSANSRVFVAELGDHLAVIEGAYSARNGDLIARAVQARFGEPVRWHAFSHLHGQYVGSTRSWIAEGATILVPPTTAPLVEEMAKPSASALRPDELGKSGTPLRLETVEKTRRIGDGPGAFEIHNVPSEHTDEYFVFWFPGSKVLLTGDLLFYRPGKPLAGRSKRLCQTVAELGIEPERLVATWPLEGYETENVVTGEKFKAACAPTP